ncbi:helix-turn-helix transcriptional regulator [Actinoallomurus sp. NPDC050550]|uniref:helix-turn-helix transcriptional regulator n=1 Tax=Actinoallomurus sp. NPDC050550 TaxID=3154937 RepID=UPI003409B19A
MEAARRARTTSYAEWAPPAEFAADVRCVWWSSFGGTAPILPDGHLDLVVGNGRVRVAGPDTVAAANDSPEGLVVHGIRFRTGRARRILGVPADELRDLRVDLEDLWGAAGRRTSEWLIDDPQRLLDLVRDRLTRTAQGPDRQIDGAVRRLTADRPRVADLHDAVGLSQRQLRRRFTSEVGYGPATFLRIVRLQRVRHLARERPLAGLADIASGAGYADQAHMSREVRNLTGMSARALLRGRSVQDGS